MMGNTYQLEHRITFNLQYKNRCMHTLTINVCLLSILVIFKMSKLSRSDKDTNRYINIYIVFLFLANSYLFIPINVNNALQLFCGLDNRLLFIISKLITYNMSP